MDRDEILEKSRKENLLHDEGVAEAQNKGRQWGVVGFLFLCVLLMLYHLVHGIDNSLPQVFFFGYLSCEAFGQYGARRDKILLAAGSFGVLVTLGLLISYVMGTL